MTSRSDEGDDAKTLAALITRRSSIKGQVTKFRNYLEKLSTIQFLDAIKLTELSLKLNKFEALSTKFDELQGQIEVLNPTNLALELDERDSIDKDFINLIVLAKNLIDKHNRTTYGGTDLNNSNNISQCHYDHSDIGFKLPLIQISKFDGSYFRWLEFRDTFTSLVHNNERINPVNKFHYLISYLEGEAARIISNLEVSAANYSDAWRLLLDRYDNKRLLISHHLTSLFNTQSISRESERSLRYLIDHVTKNLRALHSLGQETDKWDLLIIHLVSSKLDTQTLTKWEEHRNTLADDVTVIKSE